jgi:hypothetical protein
MGNYGITQRVPILDAKPEALEEACFRPPAGVTGAQQIVQDLGLRDDCMIQMGQAWHTSLLSDDFSSGGARPERRNSPLAAAVP